MPDVSRHRIVEPIGNIIFYQHIPLDKSYEHSVKYTSQAAFDGMLSGYDNTAISAQSYSRLTKGSVRVEKPLSYLQNCNYMRISDSGFLGGKVYYAFIDGVEYVNNETVDVFFTIDVLMTYWKDFTVPANFVEREHCALVDDVVGKNLVPESFELGEYIINNYYHKNYATELKYNVIMYLPNTNEDNAYVYYDSSTDSVHQGAATADQFRPGIRNGFGDVPCCLAIPASSSSNATVSKAVTLLLEKNARIIDIVQISGEMYIDNFTSNGTIIRTLTFDETATFKRTDGTLYNPRNKKLLNSPFRKLIVTNNNGQNAEYSWELFETRYNSLSRANFTYVNAFLPTPIAVTYPRYYRGKVEDYENNVTLDDFPKVNWSEDSFTKWWAQNKANYGLSLATGVLSTGLMVATGGATASVTAGILAAHGTDDLASFAVQNSVGSFGKANKYRESALRNFEQEKIARTSGLRSQGISLGMGAMNIARTIGQKQVAKATPDNANVQKNTALINVLTDHFGFTYYDMAISGEMAEIIDNYFEMFGYATHKLKVPNFVNGGRPIWDYIKLESAQINPQTGAHGINAEAQQAIQEIFNNGITLWTNLSDVGKYNLDNHAT